MTSIFKQHACRFLPQGAVVAHLKSVLSDMCAQVEILLEHLPSLGQYLRPHGNDQGLALIKSEAMCRLVSVLCLLIVWKEMFFLSC